MVMVPVRDGQSLSVRVIGRGRPVLLLHGLGMSGAHWLPFVLPHLHRHRFILPDLRGAGASADVPFKPGDIFRAHAEDVQDVIAGLGLRDLTLGGISLGATTALHLLSLDGFGPVRRYLHIDQSPCIGNRPGWPHGLFGARQDEMFARMREVLALVGEHPDCRRLAELPAPVRQAVGDRLAPVLAEMAGGAGLHSALRVVFRLPAALLGRMPVPFSDLGHLRRYLPAYLSGGHDYRPALAACTVPVMVMLGAHSPLYAEAGQRLIAEHHPRSRVVRFEHSGHVPLKDEPLRFARELGRFLRED